MRVIIGGAESNFGSLSPGEQLRLRIATLVALLRIGQTQGIGRFPALLLIDSPGSEEMVEADAAEILGELRQDLRQPVPAGHCGDGAPRADREKTACGDRWLGAAEPEDGVLMLAERLAALRAAEPVPAWDNLVEGSGDVGAAIADLPTELLASLSEALVGSWDAIDGQHRSVALQSALGRLSDLEDPLAFATVIDRLARRRWPPAMKRPSSCSRYAAALVRARIEAHPEGQPSPADTRARFALGVWTDLVCAEVASPYRLLADLDELQARMPADLASPAARAAGRVADYRDDDVLEAVMRAALAVDDAVADASIELGHHNMRSAARAGTPEDAVALLQAASELYVDAAAHPAMRPDATAYAAAIEDSHLRSSRARTPRRSPYPRIGWSGRAREMRAHLDDDAPSRAMDPLAAWLTLRQRGCEEPLRA